MPINRSSSDSSGGGVPLHGAAFESTPQKTDGMGSTTKSSDPPSDDEMALVQASGKFNNLHNDAHGYRPIVAADEYHQGNHHLRRQSNARLPSNFSGPSVFDSPRSSVPPNVASSPLYRGFGDIQARLVTAQQYVHITPGFNNEQAHNIRSILVGVGQDLTQFATTIIQEHTKSQHQAGELRVQNERAQNELLSRRQQISELQDKYRSLAQEKDLEIKTVASLEKQIEHHQKEVRRLHKLTEDYELKHMNEVQALEDEIKSLRLAQDMQLVKISNEPQPKKTAEEDGDEDGDDIKTPTLASFGRRQSSLNPTAPEFGPRSAKTDHTKDVLPLLRKYANENNIKAANRAMAPQDARSYSGTNSFEPPRRTATRMGLRTPSDFLSSPANNAFGTKSSTALTSSGAHQSRYRSVAEFVNVDFSQLQTKTFWEPEDVTHGFVRLFGMIEGLIAKHHITAPFNESDSMLSISYPATWAYILSMGLKNKMQSAAHMTDLLTKFDCRHWVMKRIIVDYIINRLIVPEIFFGFNDAIDSHLYALQSRMKSRIPGQQGSGKPQGLERQRIVNDHSKVIQFIVEAPEYEDFKRRSIAKHVGMVHEILKPMRSCSIDDEQARKGLTVCINAAWTITTKIWTSGMTLHYYFPETGSKFAFGTMRSLNYNDTPSDQMQYQQYRIMLVVTPTLSLRDDRDMDRLKTHELLKSDVLVMR